MVEGSPKSFADNSGESAQSRRRGQAVRPLALGTGPAGEPCPIIGSAGGSKV